MATQSSTEPAKSKLATSKAEGAPALTTVTTSTTTYPSATAVLPVPSSVMGLADVAHAFAAESGKRLEVMQRSQVDSQSGGPTQGAARSKESRDKAQGRTLLTSPARSYALEMWVRIEVSPGNYTSPEDNSYSNNFVVDTLNQAYLGCTGVYLSDGSHIVAFYGKKGAPNPGLTLEQGMEACKIIQEIPQWMGSLAHMKVRAISLQEAKELLAGLKRLEKESLQKAHLELQAQLSAWQLGSTLSAAAKPFVSLATSSGTAMDPSAAPQSLLLREAPTRALYITNEEGTTTDASAPPRSPEWKRGSCGGRRRSASGSQTDSSSAASVISAYGGWKKKKKVGITTKVAIPEFAGKVGHSDPATACRMCVCSITYYRDYYEDSYLMPLVVASVKNDVAGMFDFAKSLYPGDEAGEEDLGQILQKMREHYCGAFTFREQHNSVENLKQGDFEDTANFLVRVTNAVDGLGKDWKGLLTHQELETLQYEVFLNGVNKDVRHILDSEVVKHGQMTPKQMYMAVRCFKTYVARKD